MFIKEKKDLLSHGGWRCGCYFFKIRLHLTMFYEVKFAKKHETLSFLSPLIWTGLCILVFHSKSSEYGIIIQD